jgi:hypothetical protein
LETRTVPTTITVADGDVATLIAAIKLANTNPTIDTIQLAPGGGYHFTQTDNSTNGNNALPPILSSNLTIDGFGSTLNAKGSDARFFEVGAGAHLVLQNLTLQGGVQLGPHPLEAGGAIYNAGGTVELDHVMIASCSAAWTNGMGARTATGAGGYSAVAQPGGRAQGGGIYSSGGSLTLTHCHLSDRATAGNGGLGDGNSNGNGRTGGSGGSANGGCVYLNGGQAVFSNCTFSGKATGGNGGNAAYQGGPAGVAAGGGLYTFLSSVKLFNASFNQCVAAAGNGGAGGSGKTLHHGTPLNGGNAGPGADGGDALGGGLYAYGGATVILNSSFNGCDAAGGQGGSAQGGAGNRQTGAAHAGGNGGSGGQAGAGGAGEGGGLFALSTLLTISQSAFQNNQAVGGAGGRASGGAGGVGATGAFTMLSSKGQIVHGSGKGFPGGHGGHGRVGGAGGGGVGGGLYLTGPSLGLSDDTVTNNQASAGSGGDASGGAGGPGGQGAFGKRTTGGGQATGGPGGTGGSGGNGGQGGNGGEACGGGLFVNGGSTAVLCGTTVNNNSVLGNHGGSASGGIGGTGGAGGPRSGAAGPNGSSGNAGTVGTAGPALDPDVCGATSVPLSCLGAVQAIPALTGLEGWSTGKMRLATFGGGPAGVSAGSYDAMAFWGDGTNSTSGGRAANISVVLDSAGDVEVFGRHTYAPGQQPPSPITVLLWLPGQDAAEVVIPVTLAANVTDQVQTTNTTPTVNPATGLFTGAITFTNPAGAPDIKGQFDVLLAHLPQGVSVKSATVTIGTATYRLAVNRDNPQAPFLEIPVADLSDLAGGESITLNVTFKDPLGAAIVFAPGLFAAPLAAAG